MFVCSPAHMQTESVIERERETEIERDRDREIQREREREEVPDRLAGDRTRQRKYASLHYQLPRSSTAGTLH